MTEDRKSLLFCMTPGVGLADWSRTGTLCSELAPYQHLRKNGWKVAILSFKETHGSPPEADKLRIVTAPHHFLMPLVWLTCAKSFSCASVIKTNQSWRSWWYVIAAKIHRKPIVIRCGWLAGACIERMFGKTWKVVLYQLRERWAMHHSTAVMVPTERDKSWLMRRYKLPEGKIIVRPNTVSRERFVNIEWSSSGQRRVIFVGRLSPEKNIPLLMQACELADVEVLTIVGDGPQKSQLMAEAADMRTQVHFAGQVDNVLIPNLLAQHSVFSLASSSEGNPKALLEAMASGVPCACVDAPGINDLIKHGETGLLSQPQPEQLSKIIRLAINNRELSSRLSAQARRYVFQNFSAELIWPHDANFLATLCAEALQ